MRGKTDEEVRAELRAQGTPSAESVDALVPHKVFPGNRPTNAHPVSTSSTRARSAGCIAMYEHNIFTQGVVWNINSFDQWGVELGKQLASTIAKDLASSEESNHDSSTRRLIRLAKGQ